jgi:hypothetical protein
MGLYRVGADAAKFFGPFASGLLGEANGFQFPPSIPAHHDLRRAVAGPSGR